MHARRLAPLTGIAFAVLFLASLVASNVPKNSASDREWVAAYATHSKQAGHFATGILLVLAGLCLMAFITQLWVVVRSRGAVSPLPIVAAGVAAACVASGGVAMAAAAGSSLFYSQPVPGADVLRLSNDAGFALAGVAGMLAAALSVAAVSVQARRAGLFGARMYGFSLVVAVLLIGAIAFLPILALLAWAVVVAVTMLRGASESSAPVRRGEVEPSLP
jgi:hypothetical protein